MVTVGAYGGPRPSMERSESTLGHPRYTSSVRLGPSRIGVASCRDCCKRSIEPQDGSTKIFNRCTFNVLLVVFYQPLLKNIISSKWVHLPQFSGWKFQKYLSWKPPPSNVFGFCSMLNVDCLKIYPTSCWWWLAWQVGMTISGKSWYKNMCWKRNVTPLFFSCPVLKQRKINKSTCNSVSSIMGT